MLNLVEEMGRYVDQKWQDMQRDERAFSELACNALGRFVGATSPRMSANDITQALTAATDISHRDHNSRTFGQPAIRLYSGRGFYIEALFWLDASTAIHQHAFSGAFQVIEGGSVHAVYEFEQQERINSHLLVGKLNLCKAEVLRPGDTRPFLTVLPSYTRCFIWRDHQ